MPISLDLLLIIALSAITAYGSTGLAALVLLLRENQQFQTLLSAFAAGVLLSMAAMVLLPDAFGSHELHSHHDHAGTHVPLSFALWFPAGILLIFSIDMFLSRKGESGSSAVGLLTADAIHRTMDGAILGFVSASQGMGAALAYAFGILGHDLPKETGKYAVLIKSGWSSRRAIFYSLLAATPTVVAAAVAHELGTEQLGPTAELALFVSAIFLYVSLSDLVPLLKRSVSSTLAAVLGIAAFCAGIFLPVLLEEALH